MNGQGVFVPGHDDPWGTAPTPPSGTPRHRSARRTRLGPLAMAALALISVCAIAVIAIPHALAIRLAPADDPGATASQHAPSVRSGSSSPAAEPPAHHQDRRRARPDGLLARQQCREPVAIRYPPGDHRGRQQLHDGCRHLPDEPGHRSVQQPVRAVHRRQCRLLHPAPASRGIPALVRRPGHLRHPGQPAACDRHRVRAVHPGRQGRRVEERPGTVPADRRRASAVHRHRRPGLRDPGTPDVRRQAELPRPRRSRN